MKKVLTITADVETTNNIQIADVCDAIIEEMKALFSNPQTETQLWQEIAYQLGRSEGIDEGYDAGVAAAQAEMREAHTSVNEAMGIREELGA